MIPARMGSTRLLGKVLRELAGKPMLEWVIEGSNHPDLISTLIVATDSADVMRFCEAKGYTAMMTSPHHPSGTDRVCQVAQQVPADIYVNIQGDEPLVRREHIEALLVPFQDPGVRVTTLAVAMSPSLAQESNRVKVVTALDGRALYFSRSVIPHDREDSPGGKILKHLGFYAFVPSVLDLLRHLEPTPLEKREKLEQLRLLEHGVPIHVVETDFNTVGVDTEADLHLAERILLARQQGR
ncbi:MAG: 3-deoxy-manno-octulosonate cytidylyltransferase [Pseudomonadota bacterium]